MLVRLSVHLLDKFVGVATVMILEGNIYEPVLAGLVVEEGEILFFGDFALSNDYIQFTLLELLSTRTTETSRVPICRH